MGKPLLQLDHPCRRIVMLAFADCEILDVCGPMDVFYWANNWTRRNRNEPSYSMKILAEQAGPVTTMSGMKIVADGAFYEEQDEFDTLILAGGFGVDKAMENRDLMNWLSRMSAKVRRVVSICTGAFLLAECGLLDGRKATTHWLYCDRLANDYRNIQVEPDRIFIRDGSVYTSGGITAGIDLAMALVEEDLGSEIANQIARSLLVFLRRPGGQSQFSGYLLTEAKTRMDLRELQVWIINNPGENHTVEELAGKLAMSPRNFSRVFVKEVGMSPANYIELVRVNAARNKIEQTKLPLKLISEQSGFANDEHMRRAFQRQLKVSPQAYRERFQFQGN
jgi:transcriptional regulator GlxA family with amidase domain